MWYAKQIPCRLGAVSTAERPISPNRRLQSFESRDMGKPSYRSALARHAPKWPLADQEFSFSQAAASGGRSARCR
jgi:hypothetical protein